MKKDFLTTEELEELEEAEARSSDIYYRDTLLNEDDGDFTSAEQGFLLGYLDA